MSRAFTAIAFASLLAGCTVDNNADAGMVVLNNTAVVGSECTLTGMDTQPFTAHGEITMFSPSPYILTPLLESRITASPSGDDLQRTILLQGARVSLSVASAVVNGAPATVTLPAGSERFTGLFSGNLDPMGEVNVSFDLISTEILDSIKMQTNGASSNVQVEVLATATAFGTLGGDSIDASPFQYGVTVCSDCIINNLGACAGLTASAVNLGDPCNVFQDALVDCCTDTTGGFVCPAVATM